MKAGQFIDYESLAQEAMRGIVRAVLAQVVKSGLFGEHHFYIAFNTGAAGVSLSKRLREKYPQEMTIVLQHRFWDLEVGEEGFEVKLTFDGIPERLVIPYKAIKVFYDPSVPYGLQFDGADSASEGTGTSSIPGADSVMPAPFAPAAADRVQLRSDTASQDRRPRRPKSDKSDRSKPDTSEPRTAPPVVASVPRVASTARDGGAETSAEPRDNARPGRAPPILTEVKGDAAPETDASAGKVVDLSKFRKK
jgi:uncharacterized protein